jgi:hypothetical protein
LKIESSSEMRWRRRRRRRERRRWSWRWSRNSRRRSYPSGFQHHLFQLARVYLYLLLATNDDTAYPTVDLGILEIHVRFHWLCMGS